MEGDSIVVELHHIKAAKGALDIIMNDINNLEGRFTITVAGESGSGKSEIATAIANELEPRGIKSVILQQDDYFVYPPRTNDRTRRKDINWVGVNEVRLDLLDGNLKEFIEGKDNLIKPLVIYERDKSTMETIHVKGAKVAIAEGTYTTLLKFVNVHIFIERSFEDTRAHRLKRARHESELDPFIDDVLRIEHEIISSHKAQADVLISSDYDASKA